MVEREVGDDGVGPDAPSTLVGVIANARAEGAIEVCIRREHRRLVAVVALVAGSSGLAEDAVQEAWARAWERTERGERIDHLAGWVVTVALNLARTGRRRQATERRALERLSTRSDGVTKPDDVQSAPSADVGLALQALPRRQREAIVLHHLMDLDVETVGALLGVSASTVKTALVRARGSLATSLESQFGDDHDR
jgi:RNA polymerase sigma-70 factor (ECF subfamily)